MAYNYNSAGDYTYDQRDNTPKRGSRMIYSTKLIDKLIEDHNNGYDIPYDAFYQRDLELRAKGIIFEMTPEEVKEYNKCYDDPLYYVKNYCKFQTDNDYQLVKLRPFQEKVIRTVTEETWIPDLDDFGPKNRSIIWMAARQSGKCGLYNTLISLRNKSNLSGNNPKKISIGIKYNKIKQNNKNYNFNIKSISKLKTLLYWIYDKFNIKFKICIGKLIEKIERIELRYEGFDPDKFSDTDTDKIISTHILQDTEIETDTGYEQVYAIHKTKPYQVYILELENGMKLECADNHIVYTEGLNEIFVKDLLPGNLVFTEIGYSAIKSLSIMPYKLCMYDAEVISQNHRYYTDGILSHNTTTIAAFMSWMLVFHNSRNILIAANKEDTAKEIVDKLKKIFKKLPFFMKPGCDNFGQTGFVLENDSKILSTATTNTASIGFTIHCVLLDEFAHIPVGIVDNFWRSVYPTLSSSKVSQCIITSTPNGTTNKFYDLWSNSVAGKNSFVNIRTDYWEVPEHDEVWAAAQRADFGEEEFAQEFELQFNVNSKMLLGASDMQFIGRNCKPFVNKQVYSKSKYLNHPNLKWHPDFDPNDIDRNAKYLLLIDLAEGNENEENKKSNKKKDPDENTINIVKVIPNSIANMRRFSEESCGVTDAFKYVQIGKWSSNTEDEVMCAKIASAIAYELFNDHLLDSVRVMVEMNFNGKSFTQTFGMHPYYSESSIQKTYHTKPVPGEIRKKKKGFKTTTNKEFYCLKGKKMFQKRRIIVTDIDTKDQLQSFGYVKGKIKGIACHDDLSYPMMNHIPRMLDDSSFVEWLSDYLYMQVSADKRFAINQLIEKWAIDNPEMSDQEFNEAYGNDEPYPIQNNQYNQQLTGNPYSQQITGNPYSSGMPVSYPGSVWSADNPYLGGGIPPLNSSGYAQQNPYSDSGNYGYYNI